MLSTSNTVARQLQSSSSYYDPCFQTLRAADDNNDNSLTQDEFVQAVALLSGGAIASASFKELPSSLQSLYGTSGVVITAPALSQMVCTNLYNAILEHTDQAVTNTSCDLAMLIGDTDRNNELERGSEYARYANQVSGGEYGFTVAFDDLPDAVQSVFDVFANPTNNDAVNVLGSKQIDKSIATEAQLEVLMNFCRQTAVAAVVGKQAEKATVTEAPPEATNSPPPPPPAATTQSPQPPKATAEAVTTQPAPTPTIETTITQPPPVTTPIKFDFDFYTCRLSLSFSDVTRDNLINKREYFSFLDRVSDGAVADMVNFAGLPAPLQDNYNALIVSDGDGTNFDIANARPNLQLNDEQEARMQRICDGTRNALNQAFGGGNNGNGETTAPPSTSDKSPTTNAPPVEINIVKCKQDMLVSDISRDLNLDQSEYVRFVSRNTDTVGISDAFETLSAALQDTFTVLAKESGEDPNTIYVDGVRPHSSIEPEQEAFLERICQATLQAITGGNNGENEPTDTPPSDPSLTESPPANNSTSAPPTTATPATENPTKGQVVVYNAFVLSNPSGLGAVLLRVGKNRLALNRAYEVFVQNVLTSYQATEAKAMPVVSGTTRNVFLRSRESLHGRQLRVSGVIDSSSEFFDMVDSSCPDGVPEAHACVTVYAAFEVGFENETNADALSQRLTAFAQDAVLKDDALQSLITEEGPDATILVVGIADIVERAAPTQAPTKAPTEQTDGPASDDGGGDGSSIVLIAALAAAAIVVVGGGGFWYYRHRSFDVSRIKNMIKNNAKSTSSKKTSDDGSINEDPDPEMAPIGKKLEEDDSSKNSDMDGLFGGEERINVRRDDEDDEDSANFSDHDRSPERSRMRNTLDRTTGNMLGAFGGLAGGLVHGMQQGVQTVGGEVYRGVKTVGKGVKTVGNTTLNVGKTVGDVVGVNALVGVKKKTGDDEEEFVDVLDTQEQHVQDENVDDIANYGFEDPEEVQQDPFSESAGPAWEDVHNSKENDWNAIMSDNWGGTSFEDGRESHSYDDEESGSGEESFIDGDDFTRNSSSRAATSSNVTAGNMRQLGCMVDKGNWDGVMEAAANFENNLADELSLPSKEGNSVYYDQSDSGTGSSHQNEDCDNGDEEGDEDDTEGLFANSVNLDDSSEHMSVDEKKRREQYKAQVIELVSKCVPDELDNVSVMMDQFAGREAELINTLQTMYERSATQRARKAVHKSKPIQERESQAWAAGGTDGTAAIAAASTIGGAYENTRNQGEEEYDDDEAGSYYDDEEGTYSEGSGSQTGSYYDADEYDDQNDGDAFARINNFGQQGISQVKAAAQFGATKVKGASQFGASKMKDTAQFVASPVRKTAKEVGKFGNRMKSTFMNRNDSDAFDDHGFDEASGSYEDDEVSGSYESGSGDYEDDDGGYQDEGFADYDYGDESGGEFDDEVSGSYESGSQGGYDDEVSGSYESSSYQSDSFANGAEDSNNQRAKNQQYEYGYGDKENLYDDGEGTYEEGSIEDNEGSYENDEGTYEGEGSYEDDEGSYYDGEEGKEGYDEEGSGTYEEGSGTYEEGSGTYEEGSGTYYDDDDGSGNEDVDYEYE